VIAGRCARATSTRTGEMYKREGLLWRPLTMLLYVPHASA
jgi:hypothetical protein